MKWIRLLDIFALLLCGATADVVLDKKTMTATLTAAELSALAYTPKPPNDNDYDMLKYFNDEPDQALVVRKGGYCYGVFRGAPLTFVNWSKELGLQTEEICGSDNAQLTNTEGNVCCTVRSGFYDAYFKTNYYYDFEKALRRCAQDCLDPDECVVLTGHSHGGAIAAVAAIALVDLNPYVITFGQPRTMAPGCPFMASERWYRWINSRSDDTVGITYDPVPFSPGLGTESWGHFLVLGDGAESVASLGLDNHDNLYPIDPTAAAHSMTGANATDGLGYVDKIAGLIAYSTNYTAIKGKKAAKKAASSGGKIADLPVGGTNDGSPTSGKALTLLMAPINTDGFLVGDLCSDDRECKTNMCAREINLSFPRCKGIKCMEDHECETTRCDNGVCVPRSGSCQPCDENSDCKYGKCLGFRCTGPEQLMDENCGCFINGDCRSGRCDGIHPRICEAVLPIDSRCNGDSDCKTGYCSWTLRCADPSMAETQVEIKRALFSWRTLVIIAVAIVLCLIVWYGIRWYLDRRRYYETIPASE